MIKVTTYGDFREFRQRMNNLKRIETEYKKIILEIGDISSKLLAEIIRNNSISMKPLTQDYAEKKRKEGYTGNVLVRTSQYVDNIKVTDIRMKSNGIYLRISVPPLPTDTDANLLEIAMFHEYGTKNMAQRRPLGKAWERIEKQVENILKDEIGNMLRRAVT